MSSRRTYTITLGTIILLLVGICCMIAGAVLAGLGNTDEGYPLMGVGGGTMLMGLAFCIGGVYYNGC